MGISWCFLGLCKADYVYNRGPLKAVRQCALGAAFQNR